MQKKWTWVHSNDVDTNIYDTEQEAIDAYYEWSLDSGEIDDHAYLCELVPTKRISIKREIKLKGI